MESTSLKAKTEKNGAASSQIMFRDILLTSNLLSHFSPSKVFLDAKLFRDIQPLSRRITKSSIFMKENGLIRTLFYELLPACPFLP